LRSLLRRGVVTALALALVTLVPDMAYACPVCGTPGTEDAGWAYLAMTLVLSGLPLAMIGGVGYWLYRRMAAAEHDADRAPARGRPAR
jgi:hypothetical protein